MIFLVKHFFFILLYEVNFLGVEFTSHYEKGSSESTVLMLYIVSV